MPAHLSSALVAQFSEFLAARFGLHFPQTRQGDLERGILAACEEFGFENPAVCLPRLIAEPLSQAQVETLAGHLTVGETYFFREKAIFELLEQRILPELIAARRPADKRLRIWSAGCATGEEPYSIAILLSRLLPDLPEWNVRILGTDISARALRKAAMGVYGRWSFRNAPPWLNGSYAAEMEGGHREVRPDLREMVVFAYHNLIADPYPSVANDTNAMDIILCCNVMMYFQPDTVRRIAEGFHDSLVDGGWMIVGAADATAANFPRFERVDFPSAILFRRPRQPARPLPPQDARSPTTDRKADEPGMPPGGDVPAADVAAADVRGGPDTVAAGPAASFDDAAALYAGGRYDEAAVRLQALAEPRALALMARLDANRGRLTEALSWCDQAIAADKVDPRHHYLRASILQELGRDADAAESLKRTLYLDPDSVAAHLAQGNLLLRQENRQEARRHFRIAIDLLRNYPQDEPIPDLEGMTAGRLREVLLAVQPEDKP